MMVDCERIAVSVTSPQFGDNGDHSLPMQYKTIQYD